MNEINQVQTLERIGEVHCEKPSPRRRLATVRVSPGAYLAASSVCTFAAVLLVHYEADLWALIALAIAWLLMPLLAFNDRIAFDGRTLRRRGLVPLLQQFISGHKQQLSITECERIHTQAVRTLRRGGRVRYRYRSHVVGMDKDFVFASGSKSYREMVLRVFPLVHDDKLDLRTKELRDYLCDPRELRREAKALQLAPADVLEASSADFRIGGKKGLRGTLPSTLGQGPRNDLRRAQQLRQLGNRLRIAGRLREAEEAFRRALNVTPKDAWLLYEFSRLLRSRAGAHGEEKVLSRARAALRLSSLRAVNDAKLLSLLGENFLEWGEADRAQRTFNRAIAAEPRSFKARLGLADIALRTGKLAHVIHNYREAEHITADEALLRYARREADYYARLNDDDEYLSSELRRISWFQHSTRVRRLTARVTNASILIALIGPYVNPIFSGVGWSLASFSLFTWVGSLFLMKLLSDRRKPRPT